MTFVKKKNREDASVDKGNHGKEASIDETEQTGDNEYNVEPTPVFSPASAETSPPSQVFPSLPSQESLPIQASPPSQPLAADSSQPTINQDHNKVKSAVKKLTIDNDKQVDHKMEISEAAKLLQSARIEDSNESQVDFEKFQSELVSCNSFDSMMKLIWREESVRNYFRKMEHSVHLEEMLQIGRTFVDSPLKDFPPDLNQNYYHEIIKFGLLHSKNTVLFIMNLVVKKEKAITVKDVLQIAFLYAAFAYSVNSKNDGFIKLKTLIFKKEGMTNQGIDEASLLGITETSRSLRKQKDFLAEISSDVMKSNAHTNPHQSTMDKLDVGKDHMCLEFIEIEQVPTDHLSTEKLDFEKESH